METINKIRIARLRMLIQESGGMEKFSIKIERSSSQIYQWLSESPDSKTKKPRAMSNDSARYLEDRCKKPSGWMDQPLIEANVEEHPNIMLSKPLNISGEIKGGDGGYLNIQQYPSGYSTGCVINPSSNPRCYALKVVGDSMHPRIKHGEIIIVDPDKAPDPGEDVVVSLRDGRQMVKVFLWNKHGEITLGSINDGHGNIVVKQEQIYDMHLVVARLPSSAVCNKGDL